MINKIPIFETPRLFLKPVELKHLTSYEKYFIDYEVIQHLSAAVPWPYPPDGVKFFLETIVLPAQGRDRWMWGIFLKENPEELIGCVDLWREARPENRGFWLGKSFWGKGYMTEAVRPVMNYAFEALGFEKLILTNAVGNLRSRRVKEKTGATFIGTKAAKFVRSDYTETELWEITHDSWMKHNRPSFISNYKDLMDKDNARYPGSDELLSIGSPVGKKLGLKNIGIHIETLLPGRRTSWPHAESEEEEFAFVIEGHPDAWIDGYLYKLNPGDFVAFPAGTGIAHTFINNTDCNVLMLVGGEATKASNKIFYPLHPERNEEMKKKGCYWDDHPSRKLGNHDGVPCDQKG
jgi:[ribosomal protein S5]-alanine N-acetyltransferase